MSPRPIVKVPVLDSCVRCGQRALPDRALCKSCARKAAEQSDKARDRIALAREEQRALALEEVGRGSGVKDPEKEAPGNTAMTRVAAPLPTISMTQEEERQADEAASFGYSVLSDSRWADFDDGLSAEDRFLRMVPEPWERM